MEPQTNETKTLSVKNGLFTLTDALVGLDGQRRGGTHRMHVFLEDIGSMEYVFKSNWIFLGIGILFGIASLGTIGQSGFGNIPVFTGPLIIALIFLALWWFSRRKILTISSKAGTHLDLLVTHLSSETVQKLEQAILKAKDERMHYLFGLISQPAENHEH